jgi:hypothetical protein
VVHRCGEEILRAELPAKREAVLKLALTPAQDRVYRRYIEVGHCMLWMLPQVPAGYMFGSMR